MGMGSGEWGATSSYNLQGMMPFREGPESIQRTRAMNMPTADQEREAYERGLQMQEQQRRAYDSETQRQKYGILGGLLHGLR